jgi:hypothetical protein
VSRTRHSRKPRTERAAWRYSSAAAAAYPAARADAQRRANATGLDHGIEANDVFGHWHVFMLPRRENRCGFELRCEVVMCEDLNRCQSGHGPGGK